MTLKTMRKYCRDTEESITLMNLLLALWLFCPSIVNAKSKFQLLNQVELTPGALFRTSLYHDPYHLLAVDSETLIYMIDYNCAKCHTTVIGVKKSSYFASYVYVKESKVTRKKTFDAAVGAAVARRLIGKKLPYDIRQCNKRKYRLYFLQGDATNHIWAQKWAVGDISKDCPMRRSLHHLTVKDVENPNFELVADTFKRKLDDFKPYAKYDEYYGPESTLQNPRKIVRKKSSRSLSGSFRWLRVLTQSGSSVGKSGSSVGKSGRSAGKSGSFATSRATSMDYFTDNGD